MILVNCNGKKKVKVNASDSTYGFRCDAVQLTQEDINKLLVKSEEEFYHYFKLLATRMRNQAATA